MVTQPEVITQVVRLKGVVFEELSAEFQRLLLAAKKALPRSYSPNSQFRVGAAVLTTRGRVISGTNAENASYGDSICAERNALNHANDDGYGAEVEAIAIVASHADGPTHEITSPCGACRQVMHEYAWRSGREGGLAVILATTNFDKIAITTSDELLPFPFGPKDLIAVTPAA